MTGMKRIGLAVGAASLAIAGAAQAQSTACNLVNGTTPVAFPANFSGPPTNFSLDAGEWYSLQVQFTGAGPNTLTITVEEAGLPDPNFSGTVTTDGVLSYQVVTNAQTSQTSTVGSTSGANLRVTCQSGAPAITALGTASGPEAGGTSVVITGTNLGGATSVTFGGASASFTIDSNTQITAISPAGSGVANVQVVGASGASVTSGAADDFSYVAPEPIPTLTEWAMILLTTLLAGFGGLLATRRLRTI